MFLFYKARRSPTIVNFVKAVFYVLCIINSNIFAQSSSLKGQLWGSVLHGNNPPLGRSNYEETWGYIPTFSFEKNLINNSKIDLEWAYKLGKIYAGDYPTGKLDAPYRLWFRYSSDRLEARLGLQKISFGPAMILRSLSWFDTIDIKDPTGQTEAVEAFRLRMFPSNSIGLWFWSINNEQDTLSFGARTELSLNAGELGLTYHIDQSTLPQSIGQTPVYLANAHQRIAFDYRYDGFIGFWNESALISSDRFDIIMATVGADYTLPISNGILVMAEYMSISNKFDSYESSQSYTAFMASMPLGMVHQLMFILQFDLEENRSYNYLRWSSTYDRYSLNFILSISPKRADYILPEENLPRSLTGFGIGLQFMFIYNH